MPRALALPCLLLLVAFNGTLPSLLADELLAAAPDAPSVPLTYEDDIRPILKANCFHCHGGEAEVEGNLDVRLRRTLVEGGYSGAALVPGDRDASFMYQRIIAGEMPPGDHKLSGEEIERIGRWIDAGAPTKRDEPEPLPPGVMDITPEDRAFWAYQPLVRPPVPTPAASHRVRNPIDAFLLARLEEHGLGFSEEADKRTLIKRASFDLTGLPPTPDEVATFLADEAPDAYDRLIDRLLASPHYGERWGRHWLDAAGYADSEGYTNEDRERPEAFRYRDYVIRSLNADKPFDQFLREQLAGDEMVAPPYDNLQPDEIEKLVATGFLRMAADGTATGGIDQEVARNQVVADTIKIVSTSLLGLSVGCAQCHDHRYDPILQTDYYRLRALFEPAFDPKQWRTPDQRRISLYTDADRAKAAEVEAEAAKVAAEKETRQAEYLAAALEQELEKFPEEQRDALRVAYNTPPDERSDEQKQLLDANPSVNITPGVLYQYNQAHADELKKYDERIAEIRKQKPVEHFIRPLTEVPGHVPTTYLFHRGDPQQPQDPVAPGELTILSPSDGAISIAEDDPSRPTTGRRTAYANWLTSGRHPLVARVLVNRFWMHHFGQGIVGTPGDFGRLGELPTHPELLDWLAVEFMESGWQLKRWHKLVMTSTAYRQSSQRRPEAEAIDPETRLLWRMPVRRLEAEAVRDRILAAAGVLNPKMFGPPVPVREDAVGQIVVGIDNKASSNRPGEIVPIGEEAFRRSVYIQVRRSRPLALLRTFDAPVMETNCERRQSSTVAEQALMLLNSEFALEQAGYLARRARQLGGSEFRQQAAQAWKLALLRDATDEELNRADQFLAEQVAYLEAHPPAEGEEAPDPQMTALTNLCQVLLSTNEFLYVD